MAYWFAKMKEIDKKLYARSIHHLLNHSVQNCKCILHNLKVTFSTK